MTKKLLTIFSILLLATIVVFSGCKKDEEMDDLTEKKKTDNVKNADESEVEEDKVKEIRDEDILTDEEYFERKRYFICEAGGYRCKGGGDTLTQEELLRALKGERINLRKDEDGTVYFFKFSKDYTKKENIQGLRKAINELLKENDRWFEKYGTDESKMTDNKKRHFNKIRKAKIYRKNLLKALEQFEKELN